jgi:hypothetical protein
MEKCELKPGMVVQIDPAHDPVFGGHFMVVTEPKTWGTQGYCLVFPTGEKPPGRAYYRCKFENMELIGFATWISYDEGDDDGEAC